MSFPNAGAIAVGAVGVAVSVFWALGKKRVDLVRVHTELEIDASEEAAWEVLSNFENYSNWNPLMTQVHRPLRALNAGQRIEWTSRINEKARNYNAQIDVVAPNRELSWTGPTSGMKKVLFWGEHRFLIEELTSGRVRLINGERFGGLLAISLAGFLRKDVRAAYEAANEALKRQAELSQSLR